jgi:hypothetical protein
MAFHSSIFFASMATCLSYDAYCSSPRERRSFSSSRSRRSFSSSFILILLNVAAFAAMPATAPTAAEAPTNVAAFAAGEANILDAVCPPPRFCCERDLFSFSLFLQVCLLFTVFFLRGIYFLLRF